MANPSAARCAFAGNSHVDPGHAIHFGCRDNRRLSLIVVSKRIYQNRREEKADFRFLIADLTRSGGAADLHLRELTGGGKKLHQIDLIFLRDAR